VWDSKGFVDTSRSEAEASGQKLWQMELSPLWQATIAVRVAHMVLTYNQSKPTAMPVRQASSTRGALEGAESSATHHAPAEC